MRSLLLLSISLSAALSPIQPSPAQTPLIPPSEVGQVLKKSSQAPASPGSGVVTAKTISQQNLTIPSLWWANEQFGSDLLDNWLAYPADGTNAAHIDIVVNQKWSLIDYLEQYEFVNHFGTVAQDYGYNVRVINDQEELLATYTCDSKASRLCNLQLEATGRARVRALSESQN